MTPNAKSTIAFETLLFFIDSRKIVPGPPKMWKPQSTQLLEKVTIGDLGYKIQSALRLFVHGDRTEQRVSSHGGGENPARKEMYGLIAVPYFTMTWSIQPRQLKMNDGTRIRPRDGGTKRDDGERIHSGGGQPPGQIGRLDIGHPEVACWFKDPLSSAWGR